MKDSNHLLWILIQFGSSDTHLEYGSCVLISGGSRIFQGCTPAREGGEPFQKSFTAVCIVWQWKKFDRTPQPLYLCKIWIVFSFKMLHDFHEVLVYNLQLLVCNTQSMISHLDLYNLTSLSHNKKMYFDGSRLLEIKYLRTQFNFSSYFFIAFHFAPFCELLLSCTSILTVGKLNYKSSDTWKSFHQTINFLVETRNFFSNMI